MRIQSTFLLLSFFICCSVAHLLEPVVEKVVHLQTSQPPPNAPGIWRKKLIWKARWVQEWKTAKTWKPVWRKVWSPVEIREWVPIPRPPPHFSQDHSVDFPPQSPSHGPPSFPPSQGPSQPYPPSQGSPSFPPSQGPHPFPSQGPSQPFPPSQRPTKYLPPQGSSPHDDFPPNSPEPSTPLLPIADGPSSRWPSSNTQDLLTSYHTIREPDNGGYQYPKPIELQSSDYRTPDSDSLGQFLEPPKAFESAGEYQSPGSSELRDSPIKQISPYAAKLAQAVLREKFNQSLNPTERPSGLTDVVYRPDSTSTTPAPARVAKSTGQSTTEKSSNLYIVTPVAFH